MLFKKFKKWITKQNTVVKIKSEAPKKYINARLNLDYVLYLENKIKKIESALTLLGIREKKTRNPFSKFLLRKSVLRDIKEHLEE